MNTLQKPGGLAALLQAVAYVAGMALLLVVLIPAGYDAAGADATRSVAFIVSNTGPLYFLDVIVYLVTGVAQAVLALALYERFVGKAPAISKVALVFGLTWSVVLIAAAMISSISLSALGDLYAKDPAQAAWTWHAVNVVVNGLGGGTEFIGGLWIALVSWASLRSRDLPRLLSWAGVALGLAGVLTVLPPLHDIGMLFGLGMIVWFVWIGIVLMRGQMQAKAGNVEADSLDLLKTAH